MVRVRFAPSPSGSLHIGNALSAVANRRLGGWMLLRIDDTDPARNVEGGEQAILSRKVPPKLRLATAPSAFPMCSEPVGLGAKRTLTIGRV